MAASIYGISEANAYIDNDCVDSKHIIACIIYEVYEQNEIIIQQNELIICYLENKEASGYYSDGWGIPRDQTVRELRDVC